MRLAFLSIIFVLFGLAAAWTKEDHEIFDLVSALELSEGKGTTFYSLLNIDSNANQAAITKAYRKKSMQMHPDKNPGVKNIQERFARLGVITAILRSPESRERYNFFYKNGVPKWRGTGYYYQRFRPTLFHTLVFIAFLTSLAHLLVMRLNYNKDRARVAYFERSARAAAGSTKEKAGAAAGQRRRKVKVPMVEGNEGAGVLELVVEGDNVFLPHEDGSQTPLSDLATPPGLTRVWPVRLSLSLANRAVSFLPPDVQAKLPPIIHQILSTSDSSAETLDEADDEPVSAINTPTPSSKKNRLSEVKKQARLSGNRASSGEESAGTTEAESDEEEGEEVAGLSAEEKKKKKAGLGKAGGARRRKMGMKK
ncbi:uncharacterized protein MKK02DRAFT_45364 [Dioszegia hungarica]|uniref:J domain-containing protein n=1 Tax=Dioszegia hungarica TaxID=4972 RepID=A0AA38LVL9_9TREE|nr:uncharacterized protein MKK02DRAFT_45364 [Dioszegia hungarica]KAI9636658.1 hypothetical protein MKK02DRAFT_45364 [Dioszegia hungarica]